jgi:ribosomal protein S20
MPNTKSAIRRVRRVKKQTQTNRIRKSKYKSAVKQMEIHLKTKDKEKAKKYFSKFQIQLQEKFLEFQKKFPLNNQFKVDHPKKYNLYLESSHQM